MPILDNCKSVYFTIRKIIKICINSFKKADLKIFRSDAKPKKNVRIKKK